MNRNEIISEITAIRQHMEHNPSRSLLIHYGHSLQDLGQKAGYFTDLGTLLFEAGDALIIYPKPENSDDLLETGIMLAKRTLDKAIRTYR